MRQWGFSCVFTRFPKFTTQLCPLSSELGTHTHSKHTRTHSGLKMSRLTYIWALHFPPKLFCGLSRAFPRLFRLSFTVDVALKLKQKLKLIFHQQWPVFRGLRRGFPNTHTSLYQSFFGPSARENSWEKGVVESCAEPAPSSRIRRISFSFSLPASTRCSFKV